MTYIKHTTNTTIAMSTNKCNHQNLLQCLFNFWPFVAFTAPFLSTKSTGLPLSDMAVDKNDLLPSSFPDL